MKFTKVITAYGVDFDVEFWGSPGRRGTWNNPPEPAEVEDLIVSLGGQEITDLLTQNTLDEIKTKALEIACTAKSESEAEVAEMRYQERKDMALDC